MKNSISTFTFQLCKTTDTPDRFIKNVSTKCVNKQTAIDRMIKKYPLRNGFFFELKSIN